MGAMRSNCADTLDLFPLAPISAEFPMLIRRRIQFRHRNHTKYLIYILVDQEQIGAEAIVGYYSVQKWPENCRVLCTHHDSFLVSRVWQVPPRDSNTCKIAERPLRGT